MQRALEGVRSRGCSAEKIFLNDLVIRPCQACSVPPHPRHCWLDDDMDQIYHVMENVDILIIGTPAYYGSCSAQLKLVIDRSSCLVGLVRSPDQPPRFVRRLARTKRGAFSSRDASGVLASVSVRMWCGDCRIELKETMLVTGSEREGGGAEDPDVLQQAFALGCRLADS